MKKYIGTEVIKETPMTRREFNKRKGVDIPEDDACYSDEGYLVVYVDSDNYESWSPKDASGEIINSEHDAIGNMAIAFVGTSGVQMGWLASQADMLAVDWVFIE